MQQLTFITGNANKAKYVSEWLDHELAHQKLDLPEIQSIDVREVTEYKARKAFELVGVPVLVEDCALLFTAIQPLPGPFIKWFEQMGLDRMCQMLNGFSDRSAVAQLNYCVFDGQTCHFFEGTMTGHIADKPRGTKGFGFDAIFMNDGYDVTRAEMADEDYKATSYRRKALDDLAEFLKKQRGGNVQADQAAL